MRVKWSAISHGPVRSSQSIYNAMLNTTYCPQMLRGGYVCVSVHKGKAAIVESGYTVYVWASGGYFMSARLRGCFDVLFLGKHCDGIDFPGKVTRAKEVYG